MYAVVLVRVLDFFGQHLVQSLMTKQIYIDLVPNNNLPEDVETEGRMFDKQRDPPGIDCFV